MPANDFLQVGHVAPSAMLSQAAWAALAQRSAGWTAGILPPEHYNKALRQHAAVCAMIGEFIKTIGGLDALDDGDNAVLLTNFIASLDARIFGAATQDVSTFKTVTSGPVTAPPGSPVAGDEVLIADSPSGDFTGHARKLARYTGVIWLKSTVRPGRIFRVNNTTTYYQLDASTGWQPWTGPVQAAIAWGAITGTLSAQTDLQAALNAKFNSSGGTVTGQITIQRAAVELLQLINSLSNGGNWMLKAGGGGFEDRKLMVVDKFGGADNTRLVIDSAGNVGIGATTPAAKLDVAGGIIGRSDHRIQVPSYPKIILEATGNPSNTRKWQTYLGPDGTLRIGQLNDAENAELSTAKVSISGGVDISGSIGITGNIGASNKILTGGAPAAWKTLAELGMGIVTIAEAASFRAAYDGVNAIVPITHVNGCTAQHNNASAFYHKSEVTFLTAQPDTAYQVFGMIEVDDGSGNYSIRAILPSDISSKTVNGFAINNTMTVPAGCTGFSIRVVR